MTNALGPHLGVNEELASVEFADDAFAMSSGEREYRIKVFAPPSVVGGGRPLPIVYITDSDILYGAARDYVRMCAWGGELPPVVLVGIGYDARTMVEWVRRRDWDFTSPAPEEDATEFDRSIASPQGGYAEFIHFIQDKVHDRIRARHNVDEFRKMILGYSLGGQFVANVLFTQSDAFDAYAIGSPALYRNRAHMLRKGLAFDCGEIAKPTSIYLSVGEYEDFAPQADLKRFVGNYLDLARHLRASQNPLIDLKTEIQAGETHSSGGVIFACRALRHLLSKWL